MSTTLHVHDRAQRASDAARSDAPRRLVLAHLLALSFALAAGVAFAVRLGVERTGLQSADLAARAHALIVHGVVMVFLVALPAIPHTVGTLLLHGAIGARGFAFPLARRASLGLYVLGAALVTVGVVLGGLRSAWTLAELYDASATGRGAPWIAGGVVLVAISSLLVGLDVIVTIHKLRAPGVTWRTLPLVAWAGYAGSAVAILVPAPLVLAVVLGLAERRLHLGLLDPSLGGDPVLFAHLFWAFAHPALIGCVLWAIGVGAAILDAAARRRDHRRDAVALFAIALLSFTQWGTHLVGAGISGVLAAVASLCSLLALVPFAFLLGRVLRGARASGAAPSAARLSAFAVLANLALWIGSTAALSMLGVGSLLRGTPFEVAQLHYQLAGVVLTAFVAALLHAWPRLGGERLDSVPARIAVVALFVGLNGAFAGRILLGLSASGLAHATGGVTSAAGVLLACVALVLFARELLWSLAGAGREG